METPKDGLALQVTMIKWANRPELFESHPEDVDHEPNEIEAALFEEADYWSRGFGTCDAPTTEGPACGFPLDSYGSCGVESRHAGRAQGSSR